ncbi:hypothetical protein IB276_26350 [Ensifer sp. ENS04]|uniref:hypothetical protein n=1 Tax=Ensifer sp. ENS04 TaxID=2769281 RepID=UPI0017854B2D|nr:hypothetical protein [Ensifer sp. ENS04]MBD9542971.1 hypothetical protein [Ensifer sp. ENS04]
MTPAITLWLAFIMAAGAVAWFGSRRQAIAFLIVAIATAPATLTTLGHASPLTPPKGHYTVLGARIDIDEAIWVLLDGDGGPPRYYRLPYTAGTANALQAAQDMASGEGGTVGMRMGEDGSPGFAEEGGAGQEEQKREEEALLQ